MYYNILGYIQCMSYMFTINHFKCKFILIPNFMVFFDRRRNRIRDFFTSYFFFLKMYCHNAIRMSDGGMSQIVSIYQAHCLLIMTDS